MTNENFRYTPENFFSIHSIHRVTQLVRQISVPLAGLIFPQQSKEMEFNGIERARELLEKEKYGLVVLMNHFSKDDPLRVLKLIFSDQILRTRTVIAPVAFHQYTQNFDRLAYIFGAQAKPVVVPDTIKQIASLKVSKEEKRYLLAEITGKSEEMLEQYLGAALDVLQTGGIILIAPQVGRKTKLGKPDSRMEPIGKLITRVQKNNFDRVAFLFLGLSMPGVTDYADHRVTGHNIGKMYGIAVGQTITLAELQQEQKESGMTYDQLAFQYLTPLVPESYK